MTSEAIIKLLHQYGHLRVSEADLPKLHLAHRLVIDAARSYQQFMAADFQPLVAKHHGRHPTYDGDVGPATQELFEIQRCAVPDFAFDEATGSGSWPAGCNQKWPQNHTVTINWGNTPVPGFLQPVFDQVWKNTVSAYAEIGLLLLREDGNKDANIQASFVQPDGGWIGLAIVGRGQRCNTEMWCRYDKNYRPNNLLSEWTSLVKHELGHNMGLSHSQGGVMNPSIVRGLPISWKGDPSEPILNRWFGGDPVPVDPGGPEHWVKQCLVSDRGREVCLPLHPPRPVSAGFTGV